MTNARELCYIFEKFDVSKTLWFELCLFSDK